MAQRPNRLTRLPRIGDAKISFIPNDADHDGWLLLSQSVRLVEKSKYPKLYETLGVLYGGNESGSTFGLPPAAGRFLLATNENFALGKTGGSEKVTLSVDQMPQHSHSEVKASSAQTPTQQGLLTSVLNIALQVISKPPTITVSDGQTGNAGGGQPHDNMPPYLAVNVFIFAGLPVS